MSKISITLLAIVFILTSCGSIEEPQKTDIVETILDDPPTSHPPTEELSSNELPPTESSADEFIVPPEGFRDMRPFSASNVFDIFDVNPFRVDGSLGDIFFVPELEGYSLWVAVWGDSNLPARLEHWNIYTLRQIGELASGDILSPKSLSGTPDGGWLVTADESSVELWDVFRGQLPFDFELSPRFAEAAISPANGLLLAVGYASVDGTIVLYDLNVDETIAIFRHGDYVTDIDFSSDGRYLASGGINNSVFVIDVNQASQTFQYNEDGWVDSVAIEVAPAGAGSTGHILATSVSGAITLWDGAFGTQIRDLPGHPADIHSMDFSPNGEVLASGDSDGTLKIWDVASGAELFTISLGSFEVVRVTFSPDGTLLAAGTKEGLIIVWAVGP